MLSSGRSQTEAPPKHQSARTTITLSMLFNSGLGQQADGTSSRRDFKPKLKLYKHPKTLFYHLKNDAFLKFWQV